VRVGYRGEAIEPRVDEQNLPAAVNGDIVRVEIAREIAELRHVKDVGTLIAVGRLVAHRVEKAVNLRAPGTHRSGPETGKSETAADVAIEDPQFAVGLQAEEKIFPT